jgi:serine/threonine-protein kinase HipA
MTSELPPAPEEAFVWIWLPGSVEPVVAGRLARADRERGVYAFNYGRSYLERKDALPIFLPELPLVRGALLPEAPLTIAGCLRDGAPDAWGRRVIIHRLTGLRGRAVRDVEFDELTYMLHSGSDRAGALDFQGSATTYLPRRADDATLEELAHAAGRVERGSRSPRASSERSFMAPRSAALVPRR